MMILTKKGVADVLRDLVARLGLREVAQFLVQHSLELKRKVLERQDDFCTLLLLFDYYTLHFLEFELFDYHYWRAKIILPMCSY